jgi:hypothetical protein
MNPHDLNNFGMVKYRTYKSSQKSKTRPFHTMDSIYSLPPLGMDFEPLPYLDFDEKILSSTTVMKDESSTYSSSCSSSPMPGDASLSYSSPSLMAHVALPNHFDECVGINGMFGNAAVAAKGGVGAIPIVAIDRFDIVGGRGKGIQRLPGNKTYQKLVSMSKVRRYCSHQFTCRFLPC